MIFLLAYKLHVHIMYSAFAWLRGSIQNTKSTSGRSLPNKKNDFGCSHILMKYTKQNVTCTMQCCQNVMHITKNSAEAVQSECFPNAKL